MRMLRSQYVQSKQTDAPTDVKKVAEMANKQKKVINTKPKECTPIAGRRLSELSSCRCALKPQIPALTNLRQSMKRRNSTGNMAPSLIPPSQGQSETTTTDCYETTTYVNHRSIRISLGNIPKDFNLKVYIKPVHMGNQWLSAMYQKYENDLWHKTPRHPEIRHMRWYYHCGLCHKPLTEFKTLKYHLNAHLELYPYVCTICGNAYGSRSSAVRHLQSVHSIAHNYKPYIHV